MNEKQQFYHHLHQAEFYYYMRKKKAIHNLLIQMFIDKFFGEIDLWNLIDTEF